MAYPKELIQAGEQYARCADFNDCSAAAHHAQAKAGKHLDELIAEHMVEHDMAHEDQYAIWDDLVNND